MPKNNIRILTEDELHYLNAHYNLIPDGHSILVKPRHYSRVTAHDKSKKFELNSKIRKITMTVEAIDMWLDNFIESYSLFDVQNAINKQIVTYQPATKDTLLPLLITSAEIQARYEK